MIINLALVSLKQFELTKLYKALKLTTVSAISLSKIYSPLFCASIQFMNYLARNIINTGNPASAEMYNSTD